jgi:hypothetical protein
MAGQSKLFETKHVRMYCKLMIGMAKLKAYATWVVANWQRILAKVPEKEFMLEYEMRSLVASKDSKLVNELLGACLDPEGLERRYASFQATAAAKIAQSVAAQVAKAAKDASRGDRKRGAKSSADPKKSVKKQRPDATPPICIGTMLRTLTNVRKLEDAVQCIALLTFMAGGCPPVVQFCSPPDYLELLNVVEQLTPICRNENVRLADGFVPGPVVRALKLAVEKDLLIKGRGANKGLFQVCEAWPTYCQKLILLLPGVDRMRMDIPRPDPLPPISSLDNSPFVRAVEAAAKSAQGEWEVSDMKVDCNEDAPPELESPIAADIQESVSNLAAAQTIVVEPAPTLSVAEPIVIDPVPSVAVEPLQVKPVTRSDANNMFTIFPLDIIKKFVEFSGGFAATRLAITCRAANADLRGLTSTPVLWPASSTHRELKDRLPSYHQKSAPFCIFLDIETAKAPPLGTKIIVDMLGPADENPTTQLMSLQGFTRTAIQLSSPDGEPFWFVQRAPGRIETDPHYTFTKLSTSGGQMARFSVQTTLRAIGLTKKASRNPADLSWAESVVIPALLRGEGLDSACPVYSAEMSSSDDDDE